jgi:uncharacterized coiled-coil DUF342 family protein
MGSLPDPTREEFDELRRRNDSYVAAHENQQSVIDAMQVEIDKRDGEILRLGAELQASQKSNVLLATRDDKTKDGLLDELTYLRELCIANGINPNR